MRICFGGGGHLGQLIRLLPSLVRRQPIRLVSVHTWNCPCVDFTNRLILWRMLPSRVHCELRGGVKDNFGNRGYDSPVDLDISLSQAMLNAARVKAGLPALPLLEAAHA